MTKIEIPDNFIQAVLDTQKVSGLTHSFYNYPARFSPAFVAESIKNFSSSAIPSPKKDE